VHLLVSDHETPGDAAMVQGHYQSPILIQWGRAPGRARRIELTLSRFV